MVQPIQLKSHDLYSEIQQTIDEVDSSWTYENISQHLAGDKETEGLMDFVEDKFTLISLAHEEYKRKYLKRLKGSDKNFQTNEEYLGLKEFYRIIEGSVETTRNQEENYIDKINQIRDLVLTGRLEYNNTDQLTVEVRNHDDDTMFFYEGPSRPENINQYKNRD